MHKLFTINVNRNGSTDLKCGGDVLFENVNYDSGIVIAATFNNAIPSFQREKLANTRIHSHTNAVGPGSDPYSRVTITVTRWGVEFEFTICGLCGVKFTINELPVSFTNRGDDWHCGKMEEKVLYLVWQKLVGAEPEWFHQQEMNRYNEDPMGHPSQYV